MGKKVLRFKDFIKEEADYRNVTGYGSMGNPDPQNAGPSFNKGFDSDTYGRPDVIGVTRDTIEDPYFNQGTLKRRRVKKHPHVEKIRKKNSKYLRNVDRKTMKNRIDEYKKENVLIEEDWGVAEEKYSNKIKEGYKYTAVKENSVKLKDLMLKYNNDLNLIASEINDRFSGKWVKIGINDKTIEILKTNLYKKLNNFVIATNCIFPDGQEYNFPLYNTDTITEINLIEPKRIYSESDPLGEEDWEDDIINETYTKTDNEVKVHSILKPRNEWERPSITGYDDFAFKDAAKKLTHIFANKWIGIDDSNNIYKVISFEPNLLGNKILLYFSQFYSKKHNYRKRNTEGITLTITPDNLIYEMKFKKPKFYKTQHDPYGEENWDF